MQTCSFHHKWQTKHVNSITNVKIKSIANLFLCKRMCNISGVFLHYFLHILNVHYEHFHVKFMYYSMANVKIKLIPNLFLCDHTCNISGFFLFFSLHAFFSYLKCLLWTFSCHIYLLYPIFMFKTLFLYIKI